MSKGYQYWIEAGEAPTTPRRRGPKPHPDQWDLPLPPAQHPDQLWTWGRLIQAFTSTYLVDKARNTRRSYRSTFRAVCEKFGVNAIPHKASLYGWLAEKVKTGKLMPASANTMRGHLHQLFNVIRDDHDAVVLNAASFPPFEVGVRKPQGLKDPDGTWLKLKTAMPDCRVVLFLALQFFLGLRRAEVLGLEWKHLRWDGPHGVELFVTQQRDSNRTVPDPHLKHKAPPTWYPVEEPEALKLLRQVSRALMKGGLYGCSHGALVGAQPCDDGEVRQYMFPYREQHLLQISRWVEEAVPEEFPKGIRGVRAPKKFHRFRHTFCTEVVKEIGKTPQGLKAAQDLMRHKHLATTDRYSRGALGEEASREALRHVVKARATRLQARGEQWEKRQQEAISSREKPNSPNRKTGK